MSKRRAFDTDVFIIGGGPAGLAAGIAARRQGLRVTVADGNKPPIDKPCGEGLMPDSLHAAAEIGIRIPESAGHPFRGIRFHGEPGQMVDASFPNGAGLGVRRPMLHELLVAQAAEAGVEMLWSTPVSGISHGQVELGNGTIRPRWIVGADGGTSRARRWAGLDTWAHRSQRWAWRQHFQVAPWTDCMEIYWGADCQIYVTPVAADEVCVALISRHQLLNVPDVLSRFPLLEEHLRDAVVSSRERGAITATARLRRVTKGNFALIGDASGSVDAITGEGLCLSFRHAALLATSLAAGDLSLYESAHPKLVLRPRMMAELMLTMDRWPLVRRRALSALSASTTTFERMLAMHVGALGLREMAAGGLTLGWHLLTS